MSKLNRRELLKLLGSLGIGAVLPDIPSDDVEGTPIEEPRVAPNKCPGPPYVCGWYGCRGTEEEYIECSRAAMVRQEERIKNKGTMDSRGEGLWTSMRSREKDNE